MTEITAIVQGILILVERFGLPTILVMFGLVLAALWSKQLTAERDLESKTEAATEQIRNNAQDYLQQLAAQTVEENRQLYLTVAEIKTELEKTRARLDVAKAEREKMAAQLDQLRTTSGYDIRELQKEITELRGKIAEKDSQIASLQSKLKTLETQVQNP